ncbi:hypothetical protein BJX66DRAFT_317218 [Aspergillus keveii]|uniref:Uncharacterized protein n=1 Tax=Aspergillus keveii TaxID=714993 RepID=A0ABR4FLJ2_9EURO
MPTYKRPTYFDSVWVNLHVRSDGQIPWYTRYQLGRGSPPRSTWNLLQVIEDLLQYGPTSPDSRRNNPQQGIHVRTLGLRVSSQSVIPDHLLGPRNVSPGDEYDFAGTTRAILRPNSWSNESGIRYSMHPDFLVLLLRQLLEYTGRRTLFERVGAIRLLLDGKYVCEWDLDKCLDAMAPDGGDHEIWKKRTIMRRKESLTQ